MQRGLYFSGGIGMGKSHGTYSGVGCLKASDGVRVVYIADCEGWVRSGSPVDSIVYLIREMVIGFGLDEAVLTVLRTVLDLVAQLPLPTPIAELSAVFANLFADIIAHYTTAGVKILWVFDQFNALLSGQDNTATWPFNLPYDLEYHFKQHVVLVASANNNFAAFKRGGRKVNLHIPFTISEFQSLYSALGHAAMTKDDVLELMYFEQTSLIQLYYCLMLMFCQIA